jgi:hypothetical protein
MQYAAYDFTHLNLFNFFLLYTKSCWSTKKDKNNHITKILI